MLGHRLNILSERNRHYRDFTLNSLSQAMREIIASFPVYRSYVNAREEGVSERDRRFIEQAVRDAKRRNPARPAAVYDFVRDLLLKKADYIPDNERAEHMEFVARFQQVTSPVTAKGIEDTALYIYNRLVSLNEVGGEPDHFGVETEVLHRWLASRADRWPRALSATSTHDTKRSEDVRARINVLSELPGAWKQATARWARINRRARTTIEGYSYPSRNEEYLLYQTLVGSWPLEPMRTDDERVYRERIAGYMQKAMREAKVFTSWLNPSETHEQAMKVFVEAVLSPENTAFREDFIAFQQRIAVHGIYNSLAQLTLKITAPGVPDFYQGTELWDFSLVDPDNRRPVDYARRRALLTELESELEGGDRAAMASRLMENVRDDRVKLFATTALLRARGAQPALFEAGSYEAANVEGARSEHLFGFVRRRGDEMAVVVVPRLLATLLPEPDVAPLGERVWGDARIMLSSSNGTHPQLPSCFRNILGGNRVTVHEEHGQAFLRAAEVFERFPAALLIP